MRDPASREKLEIAFSRMLRRYRPQHAKPKAPRFRINHQITAREVRLIDDEGANVGVVSFQEALKRAVELGLDLIEVSPKALPPVCKIMDFGKFKYEQEKQERQQKARAKKGGDIKGIRLSLRIKGQDLEMRKNQALKFFEDGDKVRIELQLKGREKAHADRAREIIQNFARSLGEGIAFEQPLTKMGGNITVTLAKKSNA